MNMKHSFLKIYFSDNKFEFITFSNDNIIYLKNKLSKKLELKQKIFNYHLQEFKVNIFIWIII